ncbi:MAG: RNA 2',3'-cyclic phosphodiesterase [Pseudomonadota bacterium]
MPLPRCCGVDAELKKPETARVFFALWPDEPARKMLAQWTRLLHERCGGRKTRPDTIHLTLVFLGDVPLARIEEIKRMADEVSVAEFDWTLDLARCWRHNKIVWAGSSNVPAELSELVGQLETRLRGAGFALELRPYVPHVTLLRHARCDAELPALPPVAWPAQEFVLAQSVLKESGSEYAVIGRWPLQPQ